MIKPTIGRVVWYRANGSPKPDQPYAAIVTYVHSETLVNLAIFPPEGSFTSESSVPLYQGEGAPPERGSYCEWMPYQVGQAAKTEQLEKKLTESEQK